MKPLGNGCKIRLPIAYRCIQHRKLTRILPPVAGTYVPFTHSNCTCNEEIAVRDRVIAAVPQPTPEGLAELRVEARSLARSLPLTVPLTEAEFVSKYSGKRKTRYQNAVDSLRQRPLSRNEAIIQAFVKAEKFDPEAKINPAPRLIQARNARYNTRLGCFLRPIEHSLYQMQSAHGLPLIGKGLNLTDRALVLQQKMQKFDRPIVYSLDCSRFDQHVSKEMLKIEHSIYLKLCPDPELRELLKQQLQNKCFTTTGIRYVTNGRRMSGDMNTALGNCVLMIIMANAALRSLGVSKFEIFDDGDDCLVVFEATEESKLTGLLAKFLTYGHELKLENRAERLEEVIWCQTRPVKFEAGYRMVADWRKVLSSSAAGTKYWADAGARRNMAFSVGQCLLALYGGCPVLQDFALALCRGGGRLNKDIFNMDVFFKVRAEHVTIGKLEAKPITTETRLSFLDAFGMGISEQEAIEARLRDWNIGSETEDVPLEVFPGWIWDYKPGTQPANL